MPGFFGNIGATIDASRFAVAFAYLCGFQLMLQAKVGRQPGIQPQVAGALPVWTTRIVMAQPELWRGAANALESQAGKGQQAGQHGASPAGAWGGGLTAEPERNANSDNGDSEFHGQHPGAGALRQANCGEEGDESPAGTSGLATPDEDDEGNDEGEVEAAVTGPDEGEQPDKGGQPEAGLLKTKPDGGHGEEQGPVPAAQPESEKSDQE